MSMLPVGIGSAEAGGYQIERSLRFNSADSAYLNRTFTTPTNAKKFTISAWIKVTSPLGSSLDFGLLCGANSAEVIGISGTGAFGAAINGRLFIRFGDTNLVYYPQLFRDVSAWAHIVVAIDTDQSVQADRAKFYYNGVLQTATSSTITSGYSPALNTAATRYIGALSTNAGYYANGYLTEYNFIDGQNLPSGATTWAEAFGKFNSNTGVWEPKTYTGTYGNNGFYLKFADNSGTTSTTLGKDSSGNGNNWTPNNFSVTAGAGNDSLVDTPTNYGTDTGVGGEVRSNYATLNPLDAGSLVVLANGNLDVTWSGGSGHSVRATQSITNGKWYWEVTSGANASIGIIKQNLRIVPSSGSLWVGADGFGAGGSYGYAPNNGNAVTNSVFTSYGTALTNGDIVGVAFDADNGKLYFSKNGTWQNSGNPATQTNPAFSGIASDTWGPAIGYFTTPTTNVNSFNFGQRPFAYTAPSGFKALCTQNLPEPTIADGGDYFNAVTYTGPILSTAPSGTTGAVTGVGFSPDFVWIKARSTANSNLLFDRVRGINTSGAGFLITNSADAQSTVNTNGGLYSLDADGFTVVAGTDTSGRSNNTGSSDRTYVSWNWKANGAGVSNTAGTITSTVSVNTTSGFSIVTYTGNGTAGATVGHGLGVAPSFIIVKNRDSAVNWNCYHISLGATKIIELNSTNAATTTSTRWNDTTPSSTLVTLGSSSAVNTNAVKYVMYAFAPVAGYSAFGSYTGNGSADGPMIFTNFRPRYVLTKRTDSTAAWYVHDTARNTYNVCNLALSPDLADAEVSANNNMDILSNGFKIRNSGAWINASGGTYIYAAFAENAFKVALAR